MRDLEFEARVVTYFRNKNRYVKVIKAMTEHDMDPVTFINELQDHSGATLSWMKGVTQYADQIGFGK